MSNIDYTKAFSISVTPTSAFKPVLYMIFKFLGFYIYCTAQGYVGKSSLIKHKLQISRSEKNWGENQHFYE